MVATQRCIISTKLLPYPPPLLRTHTRFCCFIIKCAKRDDNSTTNPKPAIRIKLQPPLPILTKSAIAISALGFIDAGYSGDWSRIGVISKEVEHLLKFAAFVIVPFCVFVILSISDKEPEA